MAQARHVVLFVVDGLRPDALPLTETRHIDRLTAAGAHTWQAQSVCPSITLPCHASLFLSASPEQHGIVSNVWTPSQPLSPGLFDVVHEAGLGTAAFYSWEELRDLGRPGTLDAAHYHRLGDWPCERTIELGAMAAGYIATQRPAFAFVYLEAPDAVGHDHGWMSAPYMEAVAAADRAIGLVLEALADRGALADTCCLVIADHGGHGSGHGSDAPEDMTIPWLAAGPGIARGVRLSGPVSIIDTAPTIAHLLGLPRPANWRGWVVSEALQV
ncbi:MAG TPA: alkaline phosphatase family protein [Anaerolineae bacterium]|nr:alkaline phosphatase family protein [Anaerolineae bacterium]HPL28202.1 alkaline phosphatase family protein [Anaerolineae bacterium]